MKFYCINLYHTLWCFLEFNPNNVRFWVSRVAKCRPILTLPDDDCRDFPLRVTHLLISFRFHRHTVTETISATSASPIIPIMRLFRGGGISSWTVLPACNIVQMWSVLVHWILFNYVTQVRRLLSPQYRVLRVTDYLPVCLVTFFYLSPHFTANSLYNEWTAIWTQSRNRVSIPSEGKVFLFSKIYTPPLGSTQLPI